MGILMKLNKSKRSRVGKNIHRSKHHRYIIVAIIKDSDHSQFKAWIKNKDLI